MQIYNSGLERRAGHGGAFSWGGAGPPAPLDYVEHPSPPMCHFWQEGLCLGGEWGFMEIQPTLQGPSMCNGGRGCQGSQGEVSTQPAAVGGLRCYHRHDTQSN